MTFMENHDTSKMLVRQLFKEYTLRLQALYAPQEAESLTFWLLEHFLGIRRLDILQDKKVEVIPALEEAVFKLEKGFPIQYITGSAPFYGRDFYVNPAVLIPRNETEELVHLIVRENKKEALHILDVGTGSGCIPITLALEMAQPVVTTVDVSEAALDVAKLNAEKHATTSVSFFHRDVLHEELPVGPLDIIVSNPPYVRESEKAQMHRNVLDHEPYLALFVPEDDPLIFYRVIALKGASALKPGGKIYFEINEAFGAEVVAVLFELGYNDIQLRKDLNDKDRIVTAAWGS
jgi:release factor glutamine methyltransferase